MLRANSLFQTCNESHSRSTTSTIVPSNYISIAFKHTRFLAVQNTLNIHSKYIFKIRSKYTFHVNIMHTFLCAPAIARNNKIVYISRAVITKQNSNEIIIFRNGGRGKKIKKLCTNAFRIRQPMIKSIFLSYLFQVCSKIILHVRSQLFDDDKMVSHMR
jgi:hypothetical protein